MLASRDIFINIIVCSIVCRTKISVKYSDAANNFLVGGMNFNCAHKEVLKDNYHSFLYQKLHVV